MQPESIDDYVSREAPNLTQHDLIRSLQGMGCGPKEIASAIHRYVFNQQAAYEGGKPRPNTEAEQEGFKSQMGDLP